MFCNTYNALNFNNYNAEEILTYVGQHCNVNIDDVLKDMDKKRKKEIEEKYHVWQGKTDGRWYVNVPDDSKKEGRRKIAKSSKEKLYEALYEYEEGEDRKKKNDNITVEKLYPEWLEYKREHTNASTYITRIESDWKTFYLNTELTKKRIKDLDKLTLDKWVHSLIKDCNLTRKKYVNIQTIIRQMLSYSVDLGIIQFNPMDSVKINKKMFRKEQKKKDSTQVYSDEERKKLIELAWEDFQNQTKYYVLSPLALIFQFFTGVRIGELCVLRYEDIEGDYIHIQRMLRRDTKEVVPHTKTECGDRLVFLTSEAKRIIDTAKEYQRCHNINCGGYIFSVDAKPLTERCISDLLKKYCKREGILYRSSHSVRKTYGSNLLNHGVSLNTVRQQLGHSDEQTTLKYYCYDTNTEDQTKYLIQEALSNCNS